MKYVRKKIILILIIFMLLFISWQHNINQQVLNTFYIGYFSQVPENFDDLLKQTYGKSPYYTMFDDVRISVEKTEKEKYYIVYSWVTGDQSYFAITLIIEDENKNVLNKTDFEYLYIKDDKGNTIFPLPYYSLIDFPSDQPLGWKQILFVKFTPIDKDVKFIDIIITYRGEEKVIENVPVE
ncbi:MAG: hypothetical protein ACOWWH_09870 [Eubacteriaceae bacterium]